MSARSKTILGMLSMAALGTWWTLRRSKPGSVTCSESLKADEDDAMAEIIRRSLPALERARTYDEASSSMSLV